MTKISEHIRQANGKPIFSIEVIPPIKGDSLKNLLDNIEPLMEFKPPFIDVTYHREEYIEQPQPDGTIRKSVTRKRPGTVGICPIASTKAQMSIAVSVLYFIFHLFSFIVKCFYIIFLLIYFIF